VWKALGWKQTTVSGYRVGRTTMSRAHALRVAAEIGLPPEYVLACVELERETDETVRGVWQSIASRFRRAKAASIVLAAVGALAAGSPAPSAACEPTAQVDRGAMYIMSNRRRRRRDRRRRTWSTGTLPAAA
jgi:hypothetical protein